MVECWAADRPERSECLSVGVGPRNGQEAKPSRSKFDSFVVPIKTQLWRTWIPHPTTHRHTHTGISKPISTIFRTKSSIRIIPFNFAHLTWLGTTGHLSFSEGMKSQKKPGTSAWRHSSHTPRPNRVQKGNETRRGEMNDVILRCTNASIDAAKLSAKFLYEGLKSTLLVEHE